MFTFHRGCRKHTSDTHTQREQAIQYTIFIHVGLSVSYWPPSTKYYLYCRLKCLSLASKDKNSVAPPLGHWSQGRLLEIDLMSREFTLDFQPLYHPKRIFLEVVHVCTALFGEGREGRESMYIHVVEAKSTQGKFNRSTLSYRQACLSHHQILFGFVLIQGRFQIWLVCFVPTKVQKKCSPNWWQR